MSQDFKTSHTVKNNDQLICGWRAHSSSDEDEPVPSGPKCGAPATYISCMPFIDTPTCEKHKCRCAKRIILPHKMDAIEGPTCQCGKPSMNESGWCGKCEI